MWGGDGAGRGGGVKSKGRWGGGWVEQGAGILDRVGLRGLGGGYKRGERGRALGEILGRGAGVGKETGLLGGCGACLLYGPDGADGLTRVASGEGPRVNRQVGGCSPW